MTFKRFAATLGILVGLASCEAARLPAKQADLLITNGTLYDGSGAPGRIASILVEDGKIARIITDGDQLPVARQTIDARGLIIAPGFIDPHTHAGSDLASDDAARRANLAYTFQGVTTIVVGNDGFGKPNISVQAATARSKGIGTNVAYLAGFGPIRKAVIGGARRAPNQAELNKMRAIMRIAMCEGAWGFSTGLYYVPQTYAETEEVVALAEEASALGGYYDTHMRDESTYNITVQGALAETLSIGRSADIPVHIAHIKALGPSVWGHSAKMIETIEAAQAEGLRVTADQYPWDASGTRVSNALVPRWALEGGLDALRSRLNDPEQVGRIREGIADGYRRRGGADRLLVTGSLHGADVAVGSTLDDIAKARAVDPVDAAIGILMEGDARVASFNMSKADIAEFAGQDWVVTGSDGSTGHPRKYASFPKAYRDLVQKAVPGMALARFIQRSSAQTADIIGLKDRGRIVAGMAADIVVFDPANFAPRATYASPRELSFGVRYLIVNGITVISSGSYTGALPGLPLLKREGC